MQGNGRLKTEERPVAAFSKLEADGAFEVTWSNAASPALSITTDENLLDYMRTTVSGDTLTIEWLKPLKGTHGIKVRAASPTLSRASLKGAVRLIAPGLSGPEFYLEANGVTRVALNGNVSAMSAD